MFKLLFSIIVMAAFLFFVQDICAMTYSSQADLMLLAGAQQAACSQQDVPCETCDPPGCVLDTILGWEFCNSSGGEAGCNGTHKECYYTDGCEGDCTCGTVTDPNCRWNKQTSACEGSCINSSTQQTCNCEC